MPLATITTNKDLPPTRREALLATLSSQVAAWLGKSENYVMVSYSYNPDMLFAGTDQPLAYVEFKSIGLPVDNTQNLSDQLCNEINTITGIPADRIYIEFSDAARHLWGWNHRTFE